MTKVQPNKPVVRETDVLERTDPIIVEVHARGLRLRLKGNRREEPVFVGYGEIFDLGRRLNSRNAMNLRRPR